MGIEREFADFRAGGAAIRTDERQQHRPRVGGDLDADAAQLVIDQAGKAPAVVRIARQRRDIGRPFAQVAQRRPPPQIAGFDHDAAIGGRRSGQQALDGGGEILASGFHPDGAPAAEQRHGMGLLDQPLRRLGEGVALDACERKRVTHVLDRGADKRIAAFAHQAGVGTEHQCDRLAGIGTGNEPVNVGGS